MPNVFASITDQARRGVRRSADRFFSSRNPVANRVAKRLMQRVVEDYDEYLTISNPKRAIVSYVVAPLAPPPNMRDKQRFSNRGIAQEIPRALNELGYVVDVINFDNTAWRPAKRYDLFVGHGDVNFVGIARQLPPDATLVYFATGMYWKHLNVMEAARIYDLAVRRGVLLMPDRAVRPEEDANRLADGIICFGPAAAATYADFPVVRPINLAAYPVDWEGWRERNHATSRAHFLFFSGDGNVHKGLDLLLEAFAQTPLHLHICQRLAPDFAQAYRHELTECPNIHYHGFVAMRSAPFYALALQCDWVISATCADGQPGAVIECMAHGLTPILPDAAGIDVGDWGIGLDDTSIETIRAAVIQASCLSEAECAERVEKTVCAARSVHTVENFRRGFAGALIEIGETARARSR